MYGFSYEKKTDNCANKKKYEFVGYVKQLFDNQNNRRGFEKSPST